MRMGPAARVAAVTTAAIAVVYVVCVTVLNLVVSAHLTAQVDGRPTRAAARIREEPRVTKPMTEEQWLRLLDVGKAVDAELQASDARLTMGGEPTFVSADSPDAPEWNTEALGETKLFAADRLLRRGGGVRESRGGGESRG